MYWRIFEVKSFRWLVLGTAIFVSAWLLVIEVTLGFGCRPIQAWWGAVEGDCVNKMSFTYFTNVTNLVCDLWIFAMPIPIIARLQATVDRRLSLIFLFPLAWEPVPLAGPGCPLYMAWDPQTLSATDISCLYQHKITLFLYYSSSPN